MQSERNRSRYDVQGTYAVVDNDGLPSSLPSYLPGGGAGYMSYPNPGPMVQPMHLNDQRAYELQQPSGKRQAPQGQWKTPPQFLYPLGTSARRPNSHMNSDVTALLDPNPTEEMQRSFEGMQGIGSDAYAEGRDGEKITEAIFAASTGGLTLDQNLLAKMSGKEISEIGTEHIRSIMGCPDLLAIYQRLQEEDERRRKRLARNRASARARRQKKKTLVETYEHEVSQLESYLSRLKEHKWAYDMEDTLKDVLTNSKQSQMISREARRELTDATLEQHCQQYETIENAHAENAIITLSCAELLAKQEFADELDKLLELTPMQKNQLSRMKSSIIKESRSLAIVDKCFAALRGHQWLYFPTVENCAEAFRSSLQSAQFQRFINWAECNKRVINRLEYVSPIQEGMSIEKKRVFSKEEDNSEDDAFFFFFGEDGCNN